MNKKPIDKSKKSNIKCEHCGYFVPDKDTSIAYNRNQCVNQNSPKYGTGTVNYWNRCKDFKWEDKEQTE